MNKQRRKQIGDAMDRLDALREQAAKLADEFAAIRDEIDSARDDEQEAFDNSPESVQSGERGADMEAAIENLDSASQSVGELADVLAEFDFDAVLGNLDDSRGPA